MADTDLIACLCPFGGGYALNVIDRIENRSRRVKPQLFLPPPPPPIRTPHSRRDRAPTEPLGEGETPAYLYSPCLQLTFSHGPQTDCGFVFGWDPDCDIVLPQISGISFHHCALTFDKHNRPILRDLGSLNGTAVTYDNEGKGFRSKFHWIIGGHNVPNEKNEIVIDLQEHLKFQIVVSHHDITSQLYIDNVSWFRQGTARAENLLGRLGLRSRPETERASGARTPGTGPILLRRKLGEGAFGVVTHIWDVSTGAEYALKEPSEKAIKRNKVDKEAWRKEADVMRRITHVS
jgi:hypothetical protein